MTVNDDKPEKRRWNKTAIEGINPDGKFERVKTARKRSPQSARWLERQLNDPYVKKAKAMGYRSRAAFKLIEIDAEFKILEPDSLVIDLGVAPGGWAQIAAMKGAKKIVGIDLLPVEPLDGVVLIEGDFLVAENVQEILAQLGGRPDIILSDMAANTVGHRATDHLRTTALAEAAAGFAIEHLAKGGTFVTKVFQGGSQSQMLADLKQNFRLVRHFKPQASRSESVELYLVAQGRK